MTRADHLLRLALNVRASLCDASCQLGDRLASFLLGRRDEILERLAVEPCKGSEFEKVDAPLS